MTTTKAKATPTIAIRGQPVPALGPGDERRERIGEDGGDDERADDVPARATGRPRHQMTRATRTVVDPVNDGAPHRASLLDERGQADPARNPR